MSNNVPNTSLPGFFKAYKMVKIWLIYLKPFTLDVVSDNRRTKLTVPEDPEYDVTP